MKVVASDDIILDVEEMVFCSISGKTVSVCFRNHPVGQNVHFPDEYSAKRFYNAVKATKMGKEVE